MFNNIDPAKKQYMIFSAIVALLLSIFINFAFVNLMSGTFAYGFPINLSGVTGFANFFDRVINSIVMGAILTIPVYAGLMYLMNRNR